MSCGRLCAIGRLTVAYQSNLVGCRAISSSIACYDLRDFVDWQTRDTEQQESYGRGWKASELRLKSWEDLHKLWYVSLKERNMLQSEYAWAKLEKRKFPAPHRYHAVKLTMNRIKQVLSQRAGQEVDPMKRKAMKDVLHWM